MKKQVGIIVYDEDPSWTPDQSKEVEEWARSVSDCVSAAAAPELERMRDELINFGSTTLFRPTSD